MSQTNDSTSNDDLVFYVNEEGDDYTFYLHRDESNTVMNKLKKKELLKPGTVATSEVNDAGARSEVISLSERINVKNLCLTRDALKDCDDFWAQLKNADEDSAHAYLLEKIKQNAQGRDLINKLSQQTFNTEDRKGLLKIIPNILNELVAGESLENKRWIINTLSNRENQFIAGLTNEKTKKEWLNRLILEKTFPNLIKETQAGRGLICFSYVGRYLSVTFRKLVEGEGYRAQMYSATQEKDRKDNLLSLGEYCNLIYREVFKRTGSTEHAQGLLVISGSTKSAKSEITRGLIDLYLTGKTETKRRLHLVTFEDPVERFYANEAVEGSCPWAAVDISTRKTGKDYTPRQKEKDAKRLQDALSDALRQTPAVFFVGETRDKDEWKTLLDFAATGHLIVTTAHAGSLVEAMHKIFEAMEVKTPADRSEIANKLLGVIHLRINSLKFKTPVDKEGKSVLETKTTSALFPAIWRRTPRGIASLTSDGLASLLPHRPKEVGNTESQKGDFRSSNATVEAEGKKREDNRDEKLLKSGEDSPSCLGRRWFIEELFEYKETPQLLKAVFDEELKTLQTQAYQKATEWDLEGV